jgi:hypothetical protein
VECHGVAVVFSGVSPATERAGKSTRRGSVPAANRRPAHEKGPGSLRGLCGFAERGLCLAHFATKWIRFAIENAAQQGRELIPSKWKQL